MATLKNSASRLKFGGLGSSCGVSTSRLRRSLRTDTDTTRQPTSQPFFYSRTQLKAGNTAVSGYRKRMSINELKTKYLGAVKIFGTPSDYVHGYFPQKF